MLLGLGYAGVVLALGRLLPDSSDLVVAAAFSPLHRRVQDLVDQTMQPTRASLWLRHVP